MNTEIYDEVIQYRAPNKKQANMKFRLKREEHKEFESRYREVSAETTLSRIRNPA